MSEANSGATVNTGSFPPAKTFALRPTSDKSYMQFRGRFPIIGLGLSAGL